MRRLKPREINDRTVIVWYLYKNDWNRGKAAAELEITRTTLWRLMGKYDIHASAPKESNAEEMEE